MDQQQLDRRQERAEAEPLILRQTPDGISVYSARNPKNQYLVTREGQEPTCTCPDFRFHQEDPAWRCKHILSVEQQFGDLSEPGPAVDLVAHRRSSGAAPATMVLKRSVSPDGRIDSLSVELACAVDRLSADAVCPRAEEALGLQAAIVDAFLGNGKPAAGSPAEGADDIVPAHLVNVAGIDTKWGRRLFLNVQANGKTLKLFGSPKQLQQTLSDAGITIAGSVEEGMQLGVPCRITTKPSDDGRFTNVDKVFPANGKPA